MQGSNRRKYPGQKGLKAVVFLQILKSVANPSEIDEVIAYIHELEDFISIQEDQLKLRNEQLSEREADDD